MVHHFTSCLPVNETMWPLLAPTSVTNPLSSLSLLVRRRPPAGSRATENMDSVVREKRNGHDTFIFSISTEMILFEFFCVFWPEHPRKWVPWFYDLEQAKGIYGIMRLLLWAKYMNWNGHHKLKIERFDWAHYCKKKRCQANVWIHKCSVLSK